MQLGITVDTSGAQPKLDMERVLEAERLGFAEVWTGEAYGTDAVTPVAWILARTTRIKAGTGIMQMHARTPAMAAMTAISLQHLSGDRFLCGVGVSGPQVVEGWHGVPYGKPMLRTKEYIAIMRQILGRKAPLEFHGEHYDIPYHRPDATGLGKPLRSIAHGRPGLKFYTASITPAGLRTAGEVADGVLPIFYSPEQPGIVSDAILEGMRNAGRPATLDGFDVAPYVRTKLGADVAACRDAIRPELALYIGGMGARTKNFYNDVARKLGYEGAAKTIQGLYLDGRKNEAAAAVPDGLIDEISLVGPAERIKDRLAAWKSAARDGHVGTMVLKGASLEAMRVVANAVL
ncbi:MAG TPA: LLM class F420-dependent oxidoreductase [Acetobacteraceae bacterium]|nr:LLM class F420-dependent oxidoreductase [Acetobacteraceae bacterium]